jgi:hypothetical protein
VATWRRRQEGDDLHQLLSAQGMARDDDADNGEEHADRQQPVVGESVR